MKDDKRDREELVLEYTSGPLSREREIELEKMLVEAGYDLAELGEMRAIYLDIGDIEIPEARQEVSDRFYAMLEDEKRLEGSGYRSREAGNSPDLSWLKDLFGPSPSILFARMALAIVFFAVGWFGSGIISDRGEGLRNEYAERLELVTSEMTEMKKMMMFSMLSRDSASERLQAVQYLRNIATEDEEILTALFDVFEHDPNVNVRLATLDALSTAADDPRIIEVLIRNIERQESPLVQLALVDAMVSKGDERAMGHFVHLLQRGDLKPVVRRRINEVVRYLS